MDSKENLFYYGRDFNTVEINFTYYSLPNPYIFLNMVKKAKPGFLFSIKAHSSMTHHRNFTDQQRQQFFQSLKPLQDNSMLGCLLFQFPYSFKFNKKNAQYLEEIGEKFGEYPSVIEFRHNSWLREEVFNLMAKSNLAFCNVDEPGLPGLLPPTEINVGDISYIRFHGRNRKNWWNHEQAYQRYDYAYTLKELSEWIPRIEHMASKPGKIFIYFNNHYRAKAVKSARVLAGLLKESHIITSQN
ncbi:MAG: DUF72 domain-containing protein [Actinomycetia bacterium]|nr:DUF72 domain-containing protein [Actinomycetes bacterium]